MNEMNNKWRARRADYWNEALRYFRLIGNSGFMFAILVAFIAGSYYYSVFLDWLPASFPTPLVFAVISVFLLVRSPIRTFLKEADLVFLLPLEARMAGYFRKSVLYSFTLQSFTIIVVMFILSPLFYERISGSTGMFFLTLAVLLLVKYWNVTTSWQEMYIQDGGSRYGAVVIRGLVSFAFVWLLFLHAPIYILAALALVMVLFHVFYYRPIAQNRTLKWERLLEVEDKRLMAFYRIANLFTEVPRVKNRVRSRHWLTFLVDGLPFAKRSVFTSIFFKTFLRANDYFGTYMRLLVIGAAVLWLLPNGYGQLLVFLLILYISGLQLLTLWYHPSGGMWENLYPIAKRERVRSFLHVMLLLLLVMTTVFGVILLVSGLDIWLSVVGIVLGVVLSLLFAFVYLRRKITTVRS